MFFQACVDDSGSEPQSSFFVLGGFLADSSQWSNFISEWNEVLHKAPSIDYFKLNEAIALKKEFDKEKGWDEKKRDKKIDDLLDVILRHIRVRKHATIKHSEFDKYFLSIPKPKRHKAVENPYVFLAMQLIFAVAAHSPIHKIQTPCNFIFDDQERFSDALQNGYPIFRKQAFTSWGKQIFHSISEREPERIVQPRVYRLAGEREDRRGRQAEGEEPFGAQGVAERVAAFDFPAPCHGNVRSRGHAASVSRRTEHRHWRA
jgi:hypothetical protein